MLHSSRLLAVASKWALPSTAALDARQALGLCFRDSLRHFSATPERPKDTQGKRELVSGAKSNVGKLAGAIASQVRGYEVATLTAVGPEACYTGLKAIIIAKGYLAETHPGKVLAVVPRKRTLQDNFRLKEGPPQDVVATLLHVQTVDAPQVPEAPEIFAAADTNTGLMAGLLTKLLESSPSGTIGTMGAVATSKALKAVMITETYMEASLTDESVALVPTMNSFKETWREEERMRMLLTCVRVSNKSLPPAEKA